MQASVRDGRTWPQALGSPHLLGLQALQTPEKRKLLLILGQDSKNLVSAKTQGGEGGCERASWKAVPLGGGSSEERPSWGDLVGRLGGTWSWGG